MIYNIKAVCRDGGAVERARFEIVLCRNVYKGSNPFLCAMKKAPLSGCFFHDIIFLQKAEITCKQLTKGIVL